MNHTKRKTKRQEKGDSQRPLARILLYLKPQAPLAAAVLLLAAISVALTLYAPVLSGECIDLMLGPERVDLSALPPKIALFCLSVAGAALAQWLMSLFSNKIVYRVTRTMRCELFETIQNVPLKFLDSHPHGDILSRMISDTEQVADGLLMGITQLFTGIATIIGTLLVMLTINAHITLLVVVATPLSLLVASFISNRTYRLFRRQTETRGDMTALANEMIAGHAVVKAFGYEDRANHRFSEVCDRLQDYDRRAVFFSALTNPSTRFINNIIYFLVGATGAISVLGSSLSIGSLSCLLAYANQYTKPFNEITGVITEMQSALASAARIFSLLDEERQRPDAPNAHELSRQETTGEAAFRDVSFSYHPDVSLIEHLNAEARPGQRIAIVGPTGCGKTTLINLLMRFYDVTSGEITISGYPLTALTRKSLRRAWGMVLQDTWLKTGTVRENLAYGRPDATDEEIEAAARAAYAHNFIMRLPQGYDTLISEEGGSLSQGQRQLLCIARVILVAPPMLILDEATSSIDTRTELRIQRVLTQMMEGRTSFIVAHRLSTIREADCILVMEKGKIVESGKHQELLEAGGFYANLYKSQFSEE